MVQEELFGNGLVRDIPALQAIVDEVSEDMYCANQRCQEFKLILEEYQEQPQLLDPHLETLVTPMTTLLLQACAKLDDTKHFRGIMQVNRLLQALVSTRGHKTLARFFPNKPQVFEHAMAMLQHLESIPTQTEVDEDAQDGWWQSCCVLFLWLSSLVMIPFDMTTLRFRPSGADKDVPIVDWLVDVAIRHLSASGRDREMAAVMLSRLLIRKDADEHVKKFLAWFADVSQADASKDANDAIRQRQLPGVLATLAAMFKVGLRERMLPLTGPVWKAVLQLTTSNAMVSLNIARKLTVKVLQRCALTQLDPTRINATAAAMKARKGRGVGVAASSASEYLALTAEGAAMLTSVIDCLLMGLTDSHTIVRWSAAKGLGRIAVRLPAVCVEDINTAIQDLFSPARDHSAWQGACLALAETVRHGLLPQERLPQVVPLVCKALHYEQRRGVHSVGQHVRDAAAYVCWAFARTYKPEAMAECLPLLTPVLLATCCYDREVNCRRAASAAFQECVGRLGAQNFPNGIDILTSADYFILGSRRQSYITVGPTIASLPPYRVPLATHLVDSKLGNWDVAVRELAAEGLAALVPLDPSFFAEQLGVLLPRCTASPTMEMRHGCLLAVAELLQALTANGLALPQPRKEEALQVVLDLHNGVYCRGKGGEMMRVGICKLIATLSTIGTALADAQVHQLHDIVKENLSNKELPIQQAAGACLTQLLEAYHAQVPTAQIQEYEQKLFSELEDTRRGSGIALAALPAVVTRSVFATLLPSVCKAANVKEATDWRDANARAHAIQALEAAIEKAFGAKRDQAEWKDAAGDITLHDACVGRAIPLLLTCMQDYTTDKRGDVGSWVREHAMKVLVSVCTLTMQRKVCADTDMAALLTFVVAQFLKQSVERIERIRNAAMASLVNLLTTRAELQPGAQILGSIQLLSALHALGKGERVPVAALLGFLQWEDYRRPMLEAAVACVGGVNVTLAKSVADAMACVVLQPEYMKIPGESDGRQRVGASVLCDELLAVWSQHVHSPRLATPMLRTLDVLLCNGVLRAGDLSDTQLEQLLEATRTEGRGCTDVPRMCAVAAVLSHLIGTSRACQKPALQAILVMLASKVPRLRQTAAEQLLFCCDLLLESQAGAGASGGAGHLTPGLVRDLQEHLWEVDWSGAREAAAREAKERIAMGLRLKKGQLKARRNVQRAPAPTQYQLLVNDVARGF